MSWHSANASSIASQISCAVTRRSRGLCRVTQCQEHSTVRDTRVYDGRQFRVAVFGIDPVADLEGRELEDANVHHVTTVLTDLDAISDFQRMPPEDETPAGEIEHQILQRDREAC